MLGMSAKTSTPAKKMTPSLMRFDILFSPPMKYQARTTLTTQTQQQRRCEDVTAVQDCKASPLALDIRPVRGKSQ
jgi:hypothetical protein